MSEDLVKQMGELKADFQKLSFSHQGLSALYDKQVKQISILEKEMDRLRVQTSIRNEDLNCMVGPVRIKTVIETYLGKKGFNRKNRKQFVSSFREKDGLIDGNTLKYLTDKYATETKENTTHTVTVKRVFRLSVKE
jgi:superfamily II RNA helicase